MFGLRIVRQKTLDELGYYKNIFGKLDSDYKSVMDENRELRAENARLFKFYQDRIKSREAVKQDANGKWRNDLGQFASAPRGK